MRMLMGGTKKHVDDTQTFIMVGVNRLREEYELGKSDQMKDEHWRKQLRISLGIGVSSVGLIGAFFGVETMPLTALFVHCLVHIVL